MLLSLPPSLLALVCCMLQSRAAAAESPASATPQFGNIAGYIASGLGADNGSATHTQPPSLASTGSGQEYASKCQAALVKWSSASFDYMYDAASVTTTTFSSAFTETLRSPGTTKVTSVITLCDGHPRVVGRTSVSTGKKYTSTEAWTNTITSSERNTVYPTPAPCSIQPEDCKTLSSSYEASLSSKLAQDGFATGGGPLCTITPSAPPPSYSTNARGSECNNCMIHAHTARVMYWPVTTGANGDLCNKTASTITSSPTGPPASFVTEGITITSPTVAVSLALMSRVDGCGTTINHTIIPVKPEQVTSVRGYRALFEHHRFNFADLNYFCMDTNTTNYTLANGAGDSCYQQVPAAAYFGGLNNAAVLAQAPFRNLTKDQLTIYNDYQPQLLPPATISHEISSIWGDGCIIHPDGVWDPPIALTPEASLDLPSYGPGETTSEQEPEKTPATPINPYGPVPPRQTGIDGPSLGPQPEDPNSEREHFTALPEKGPESSPNGNGGGNASPTDSGSDSGSGSGSDSGSASHSDSGSGSNSGSDGHDASNTGTDSNNNSSDINENGSNGGGSPQPTGVTKVHTTVITVGNKVMACSQDSNGAWVIPDASTTHVASQGGTAVDIDAATYTAGSQGLVRVQPSSPSGGSSQGDSQAGSTGKPSGDASETSSDRTRSSTSASEDSTQQSDRAQATRSSESESSSTASSTGTSEAGPTSRWSPISLTLALLAAYFCAL